MSAEDVVGTEVDERFSSTQSQAQLRDQRLFDALDRKLLRMARPCEKERSKERGIPRDFLFQTQDQNWNEKKCAAGFAGAHSSFPRPNQRLLILGQSKDG